MWEGNNDRSLAGHSHLGHQHHGDLRQSHRRAASPATPARKPVIVSGTGMGQNTQDHRSENGNTITVTPPWNIVPDTTSVMILSTAAPTWPSMATTFGAKSYAS